MGAHQIMSSFLGFPYMGFTVLNCSFPNPNGLQIGWQKEKRCVRYIWFCHKQRCVIHKSMSPAIMGNCSSLNATPDLNKYLRHLVNKRYTFGLANLNHVRHKVFNISFILWGIQTHISQQRNVKNKYLSIVVTCHATVLAEESQPFPSALT